MPDVHDDPPRSLPLLLVAVLAATAGSFGANIHADSPSVAEHAVARSAAPPAITQLPGRRRVPPPAAGASAPVSIDGPIANLVRPYVDRSGAPGKAIGLAVGVTSRHGTFLLGYGARTVNGTVPPGADDLFEIGSVTKVVTGFLLARAVELGDAALADSIDPWFPAGAPHFNGHAIGLLDLATHTSGLPNFPNNMHSTVPGSPAAGYTAQDLANFMAGTTLTIDPGTAFGYSNLGAGTLGHILVQAGGASSYEALVQREIADPLGMDDTRIVLSPAQVLRRIQGHVGATPAPFNEIGEPLAGGGALRSSARDMLAFLLPAVGTGPAPAVATWQTTLLPRRPSPFGVNGATGLLVNGEDHAGTRLYSKNGGTAGFTAQICFTTSPPVAVVLLANSRDVQGLHTLGTALVDLLSAP